MHSSARAAARLLAAALAAAGCGAGAAPVRLPRKPSPAQLAGGPAARLPVRQLVIAAYEGYWRATSDPLGSRDPARAPAIPSGYGPRPAVPGLIRGLRQLWRKDEIAYGSPQFHIMSVRLTGPGTAAVHDCIDLSHAGFQDSRTGVLVGGLGPSHEYLITTLALVHGRWLVTGAVPVVRPCGR